MTDVAPVVGIVAGEASGDLLGAHLIDALRGHMPELRFVGIGGPRMLSTGAMRSLFPMDKLAVRGYAEVMRHYLEIVSIRRQLAAQLLEHAPALFIGVDAPDFNLDLELKLKRSGIPSVHYVSPSIWAWRGGRIGKIRRAVNKMLTLFPFEAQLYQRAGIPVCFVGHPLADSLAEHHGYDAAREQLRVHTASQVVALLPGSRVSELESMADLFVESAVEISRARPETVFLAPMVSRETRNIFEAALYRRGTPELKVSILFGHAHDAMAAADVVLAASGTVTLEAALLRRPMVITYKMPQSSWWIMSNLRYQPYVGLPNILAGEFIVPEFLQHDATADNLAQAVLNMLSDSVIRARLDKHFDQLLKVLKKNTAERAADVVLPMLRKRVA